MAEYRDDTDVDTGTESDTDTQSDTASDTQSDTETDTQSDTETETETETQTDPLRDGRYAGTVLFEVDVATVGLTDDCEGPIDLVVDEAAMPQIQGTMACEFVGPLSIFFPERFTGTIEGDIVGDPNVSGSFLMDLVVPIDDTWTGQFSNAGRLSGAMEGDATVVTYTASFAIWP